VFVMAFMLELRVRGDSWLRPPVELHTAVGLRMPGAEVASAPEGGAVGAAADAKAARTAAGA
jgi:hypothetical protein